MEAVIIRVDDTKDPYRALAALILHQAETEPIDVKVRTTNNAHIVLRRSTSSQQRPLGGQKS